MPLPRSTPLLLCLLATNLHAREILIPDPAALKPAIASAQPGDILTLKDGTWKDADLTLTTPGQQKNPITLRAQTPGQVILTGASHLDINAPYITIDGLLFQNGSITHGAVLSLNADHATLRNTAVIDYNPAKFDTNYYWLFFKGSDNRVEYCFFKGKSNMEPVVGNDLDNARRNVVTHCYFKDIPYVEANGREILRIWGPGKYESHDDDGAFFTIDSNLFDHADGEGSEIISLKSNHNRVTHNTILATRGGINIRRGDYNTIADNIILGQGVDRAARIRMSGRHNLVQHNYISGCKRGIEISTGDYIDTPFTPQFKPDLQSPLPGKPPIAVPTYDQVQDLTLADNTVVDSSQADLAISPDYKKHWPEMQMILLPENCLIKNNRLIRPHGGASITGPALDTKPPLDRFSFKPNTYTNNLLLGGVNAYPPSESGFQREPIPKGWTEESERASLHPLTPADVGPDWMTPKNTTNP